MENTASNIDKRELVYRAANWQTVEESILSRDTTHDSFCRLMIYRRELARKYLQEQNEESQEYLFQMLQRCNEQIKQILGL